MERCVRMVLACRLDTLMLDTWHTYTTCTDCKCKCTDLHMKYTHAAHVTYSSYTYDIHMDNIWKIHDICDKFIAYIIWCCRGMHMEFAWLIHNIHMEYTQYINNTWHTHGIHMEYIWYTHCVYIENISHTYDRV